jgi:hypothetical protein
LTRGFYAGILHGGGFPGRRGIVKLFGRMFVDCANLGSSFATDWFSAVAVYVEPRFVLAANSRRL